MKKILVVDDDTGILDSLQEIFEMSGYEVRAVGTSKEANALLDTFMPDLILVDLLLSGENGTDNATS